MGRGHKDTMKDCPPPPLLFSPKLWDGEHSSGRDGAAPWRSLSDAADGGRGGWGGGGEGGKQSYTLVVECPWGKFVLFCPPLKVLNV